MNIKIMTLGLASLVAGLLCGCGERHEARSLARDFMDAHMDMKDYDVVRWLPLDSTFFVTPTAMKAMQAEARRTGLVHGDATYQAYTPKLLLMRGVFAHDRDTVSRTFYFDAGLKGVAGVKER